MAFKESGVRTERPQSPMERAKQKLGLFALAAASVIGLELLPATAEAQLMPDPFGTAEPAPTPVREAPRAVEVPTVIREVSAPELDRSRQLAVESMALTVGPENSFTRSHAPIYRADSTVANRTSRRNPTMNGPTGAQRNMIVAGGDPARALEGGTFYVGFERRGIAYSEAAADPNLAYQPEDRPLTVQEASQREVVSAYQVEAPSNAEMVSAPLLRGPEGLRPNNHFRVSHVGRTREDAVFQAMADMMRQNAPSTRNRSLSTSGDQARGLLSLLVDRTQSELVMRGVQVRVRQLESNRFEAEVEADLFVPMVVER